MPFSDKTLQFLFENRLHDSKEWFEEHKAEYTHLVFEPLRDLVTELAPRMLEIDPEFIAEPRVDRTICRIRRDTRFSRDKSLYRDNMWLIFKRGRMHTTEFPGYYFEVNRDGFSYGCGFYNASTSYMETMRRRILEGERGFAAASRTFESQPLFHMEGDCYKRPHFAGQPENARRWLERRNLCFTADSADFGLLYSDRLADCLAEGFRRLKPVYAFLLETARAELRAGVRKESYP